MTRRGRILLALLLPSVAWAVWQWSRPYEWRPDPAANARIDFAQLKRDRDYHWLELKITIKDAQQNDLSKGIALILPDGREKKPDGLTLQGKGEPSIENDGPALPQVSGMSLQFWMEPGELIGPLKLRLNEGEIKVRTKTDAPSLADGETETYHTCRW